MHRNIALDNRVWVLDLNELNNNWSISYSMPVVFLRHLSFNAKGNIISISNSGSGGVNNKVFRLNCPEYCSPYAYEVNYFFCSNEQIILDDGSLIMDTTSIEELYMSSEGCDSTIIFLYNHYPVDTTDLIQ